MADYKQMYRIMFRAMTKAIEILEEAQQRCEEMYIATDDEFRAEPGFKLTVIENTPDLTEPPDDKY